MAIGAPTLAVLRALGLGDLLTAVPALRALAAAFPDHHRLLGAPAVFADVVALTRTGFTVVDVDLRGRTGDFPPLPPEFHGPDVAVNLHGRGPQSTATLRAAEPQRLVAFGEPGCPDWQPGEHEVHRWCRLLTGAGIPSDPADLFVAVEPADLGGGPPVTVLHPGAAAPARRWPVDRWAHVARHESMQGHRIVLTGGPQEQALATEIAAAAGLADDAVLAGKTSVVELAGVISAAVRVVCGDTGAAHLATAVGTPSVVLFGPVSPAEWGPPADRAHHVVLWAGRRGDPHGEQPDPGLLKIAPDDVINALAGLPVAG